jgi:hypothetical protein
LELSEAVKVAAGKLARHKGKARNRQLKLMVEKALGKLVEAVEELQR